MARIRRAAQSAPQEVLVPEAEQPYAVPENWRWVRLGGICSFIGGGTPNKNIPEYWNGNIPWASVKDIKGKFLYNTLDSITESGLRNSSSNVCDLDDIIIVTRISPGNVAVAKTVLAVNQDLKIVKTQLNNLFLYYCFVCLKNEFIARSSGTTVLGITLSRVQEICVPLPPRAEQERIVARIESLFARLDKAREKVDAVLGRCAARKAALLHKAFSGELTAGKAIKNILLEDIVLDIKIGPFGSMLHKDDYISNGVPIVNPKHIEGQKILVAINNTISKDKAEELAVYALKENDIVLGRRGEMGRCAPVSCAESGWICGTGSMIIRLKPEYNAKFYSLFISSCQGMRYLEEHAVGTTLKNLNEKIVRKLPVPSFSQQEQAEIVRILDELLARERRAQEAAERVAARIEQIKRAVLTKAFRGELGTNDPAEPAALTEQGSLSLA
ncbi:MAG TPA: restriction endonuclease subunit S [Candidatus Desulfovibrio intestinigallinarum]|nr:restriction endonuclease subunit S [Candidatus Desulfovibrio intestinigallinarum]